MKIKGILVKVGFKPEVIEFEESLEALQTYVGGLIEIIQFPDDEDVDIVINEEGKYNGSQLNKFIFHNGKIVDILMGDILIVGGNNLTGETVSVPEDKIEKYIKIFSKDYIEV